MKRVTGIGGIFFSAQDPVALRAWCRKHPGIEVQAWGGAAFAWADAAGAPMTGTAIWSIGGAEGAPFAPGTAPFMVNYRVDDLAALLQALRDEGCKVAATARAGQGQRRRLGLREEQAEVLG